MHKLTKAILLACLIWLAGCTKKEEKEAEPVVPVEVTAARLDSIRHIVSADAVLWPRNQASVTPKVSAPVKKFYVNRGDHVKEGQLLAVLENRDLQAAAQESKWLYEQAQANYKVTSAATVPEQMISAQSGLDAAKQALDAAQKVLESREKLFREGALARRQVDEAQVAYAQARSQYETAKQHLAALQSVSREEQIKVAAAQADAAKAHYQGAEAQLGYTEVRSPITGVITDRSVYEGEMANAGTPLLTLMDVSRIVARANIPQDQAADLKVGNAAMVAPAGGTDPIAGKVTVVSPAVDPNSTTLQVWVEIPNSGEGLRPGTSVRVSIVASTIKNALVVPPAALLPNAEGETTVMVVGADSKAHEHKVEIGVREPDKVQILSGVKPGDQVITVGGVGLEDNAQVTIAKPGENKAKEE
ncbi:MAG TPA: efflux RND transporter periplasmic adaptor subunit [Bryobacteraceae bacterium]|nr:efflux RND transporter periplasmic adaptor subunit [Bryobacteraceae bacterium]